MAISTSSATRNFMRLDPGGDEDLAGLSTVMSTPAVATVLLAHYLHGKAIRQHMKSTFIPPIALLLFILMGQTFDAAADEKPIRKHWFVSGQVQGVGFRAFTYESATDLELKGWVRNLTDGRVEIVAQGNEPTIAKLLERVKKGPQFGRVDSVKEAPADEKEALKEKFEIRDSAVAPKDGP